MSLLAQGATLTLCHGLLQLRPIQAGDCASLGAWVVSGGGHDWTGRRTRRGRGPGLLGLGQAGHIGFNEPPSARDSRTRRVHLDEVTRRFDDSPIDAIEINISCPNVKEGGVTFLHNDVFTNGVSYLHVDLDVSALPEELERLASHYDVDVDKQMSKVCEIVPPNSSAGSIE